MKQELDLIHCGIKQSLENVNYEYAPNDVVDYINENMGNKWVYFEK